MRIQSMFKDDINRKINGVVKVDQDESSVLVQELNEYVTAIRKPTISSSLMRTDCRCSARNSRSTLHLRWMSSTSSVKEERHGSAYRGYDGYP